MTPEILPPLDSTTALALKDDIENLCGQIAGHELRLSASYARLGSKLREVKNTQAWIVWGYSRFSTYLETVRKMIDRQRSQVYAILQVAEALLPYLTEDQLETIGISKAHELRRLVKGGLRPEATIEIAWYAGDQQSVDQVRIMDYAMSPDITAADLRVQVNGLLHQEETPQGYWTDIGGCYFLSDEKKEWERAVELGKRISGVGAEESEHAQLKEALLAMAREVTVEWTEALRNDG